MVIIQSPTGRYTTPKTPRNNRTCSVCPTKMEGECRNI